MNKLSIILPVRNGGHHFKKCVNSILAQTVSDFNLHILDNCSDDGSGEWISSLNDPRIILVTSSKPLSIEESWGRIIHIPKNEFITLIGHDDLLHSNYLEKMSQLILEHPNASLYQSHFNLIDSAGKEIRKCKPMSVTENAGEFLKSVLSGRFDLYGTGFMMRSLHYDQLGGIPMYPNLLFADFELWMNFTRLSYKATSSDECFSYRLHQSTTKISSDLKMHEAFSVFINYLLQLKNNDRHLSSVINKFGPEFIILYCKGLSHRLLRTPFNLRNGLSVRKFVYECKQLSDKISPGSGALLDSQSSINLAKFIDSNSLSRQLFLWFKQVFPKPLFK